MPWWVINVSRQAPAYASLILPDMFGQYMRYLEKLWKHKLLNPVRPHPSQLSVPVCGAQETGKQWGKVYVLCFHTLKLYCGNTSPVRLCIFILFSVSKEFLYHPIFIFLFRRQSLRYRCKHIYKFMNKCTSMKLEFFHYAITRSESNDKNAINSLVTTKGQRKDY